MAGVVMTLNDHATGTWSTRAGLLMELVPAADRNFIPGHNRLSVCVRVPGGKPVRLPARWLDPEPEPERRCETCGQLILEER